MLTQNQIVEGAIISLPSFAPIGRSEFRIVKVGEFVSLSPVTPDGHYVSGQIGVRTLSDVLRNGRAV